jgi:hypothetical protein
VVESVFVFAITIYYAASVPNYQIQPFSVNFLKSMIACSYMLRYLCKRYKGVYGSYDSNKYMSGICQISGNVSYRWYILSKYPTYESMI